MRINNKKYPTNYIVIAMIIFGLVLASVAWWFFSSSNNDTTSETIDSSIDAEPAPSELSDEDAASKQKFIEEGQDSSDSTDSDDTSDTTNTSGNVKLAAKQDGSSVTVTTQITTIGDGSCELSITNGTKKYTATADVIYQPAYSTCAGFSVPVSELGEGTWNIAVSVTSANGAKAAATTTLEAS